MTTPFSGAIDLSGLKTSTTITQAPEKSLPEGVFLCEVPGGCNLAVRGGADDVHEVIEDCLATCFPYVDLYRETKNAAIEVAEEYHRAVAAYREMAASRQQVLAANQRLGEDNDRLKAELREARKGTPAAEKHVLAGAEDLRASMMANFGTKPPVEPSTEEPRLTCKRCNKDDTEPYDYEGVNYVWCKTCEDDAE